jgi:hypothetical protein
MKTRALSLAILLLGATGVATADQDDHRGWDHDTGRGWDHDTGRGWDHDRGRGWSDKHSLPTQAPEIDPASLGAALTLLGGGLAVLRGRRPIDSKK